MKKILLISNKVFHYRVSIYNYFTERFADFGIEFLVRANELEKASPYPLRFDFKEIPFSFSSCKKEIEQIQPDVVILFLHLKDMIIWPLTVWLRMRGMPVVYWNKGINLEVSNPGVRNYPFYLIHLLSNAIILYSKNEIKDIKPGQRHKVFVANNTVNFSSYPAIAQTKEELKKELNVPFEKIVLFVGRMRPVKKVEHLIQVFNTFTERGVGCVIVGDSMGYDLERLIKNDNILYLGPIHDPKDVQISKIFKMSDIFCIPGDVGLGLNQAFYWGLPVVTEAGLQPPEINYLRHGRNGYIVPENDVDELRNKILLLLHDKNLLRDFSVRAREDILRDASVEKMFQGFRECFSFLSPVAP